MCLSDVDSEHEDDTDDSLSWNESDPESNEVSDSYSEISASESDLEEEQDGDGREILGKDGYVLFIFLEWDLIDPMVQ
jgi:hypothetical protein